MSYLQYLYFPHLYIVYPQICIYPHNILYISLVLKINSACYSPVDGAAESNAIFPEQIQFRTRAPDELSETHIFPN